MALNLNRIAFLASTLAAAVLFAAAADSAPKGKALEGGLIETITAGPTKIVRLTHSPNFVLAADESIHPQVPANFTLGYDGVVRILQEGDYTFDAGPAAKITLDSRPADKIHLSPGDHPFHLDFMRPAGPVRLQLTWSSNAFPSEPVPPGILGHVSAPAEIEPQRVIERGRLLVQELNCIACHKGNSAALAGRKAPDLETAGSRLSPKWIVKWLEEPRHFREHALMPAMPLKDNDRRDIATYLATLTETTTPRAQPTFTSELAQRGQETFESIGCVNCHAKGGFELNGLATKWTSTAALARFLLDPLSVDPSGRMPSQMLDNRQAEALAAFLFTGTPHDQKAPDQSQFAINSKLPDFDAEFSGGDAGHGKTLVHATGCMKCHTLGSEREDAARSLVTGAKDLAHLNVQAGCLAPTSAAMTPRYALSPEDRAAITAYLRSAAEHPEASPAPTYAYLEDIQRFNCVVCHTAEGFAPRQTLDGVPPLSIAGQKLRPEWIAAVLEQKQRVRPWLRLRMPHFGSAVKPLVNELVAVSGAGPVEETPTPSGPTIREGLKLSGNAAGSFACVTCHAFNGSAVAAPEQSRGPELTLMVTRLRPDYFRRWVREPGRIVPNTVMPAFFTDKPASESMPVINAIWGYFSLGKGMPLPEGVTPSRQAQFALTPIDVPLVQRCYLDGGGVDRKYRAVPRAIAVGLPGLTSYVFDPDLCQLDYAWSGGFVDMTKGWNGRGDTHGVRLGTPFYNAPAGSPIFLNSMETKPTMNYIGYAAANDQVEMIYSVDGVEVHERCGPAPRSPGLVRTFELNPVGQAVYFAVQDDAGMKIVPSQGSFEPSPAPAGWETSVKAKSLKIAGAGKITFSIVITPSQDSK